MRDVSIETHELTKGILLQLRRWLFVNPIVKQVTGYLLDVGCRQGLYLESYPGRSFGIDKSEYWIKTCRQKGLNVFQADAEVFTQWGTFDTVLLSHILEHTDKPSKLLANAYSNTKSGGRIIVLLPCWQGFLHGFNDLVGHKQFITKHYVDYYLLKLLKCKKLKASKFPPINVPFLSKYQELRLIYQKEVLDE